MPSISRGTGNSATRTSYCLQNACPLVIPRGRRWPLESFGSRGPGQRGPRGNSFTNPFVLGSLTMWLRAVRQPTGLSGTRCFSHRSRRLMPEPPLPIRRPSLRPRRVIGPITGLGTPRPRWRLPCKPSCRRPGRQVTPRRSTMTRRPGTSKLAQTPPRRPTAATTGRWRSSRPCRGCRSRASGCASLLGRTLQPCPTSSTSTLWP